jgi:hypothetical protein
MKTYVGVDILNDIAIKYNLKISANKIKTVAVKGKMNVRTKILINECIVEQVNYPNFM